MSTPDPYGTPERLPTPAVERRPLSFAELHTSAVSVLERVELIQDLLTAGSTPADRTIGTAMASAIALHEELGTLMLADRVRPGDQEFVDLCGILERIGDALETVNATLGRALADPEVA